MHTTHFNSQSGAALIVSLLILLVMTVIGISSMQTTNLQEKMASNTREREQAFEAAESALRNAEAFVENNVAVTANFDTDGSDGLYDDSVQELWKTLSWTVGTDAREHSGYASTYSYGSREYCGDFQEIPAAARGQSCRTGRGALFTGKPARLC